MPPPSEPLRLWPLTQAAGPLDGRFIADEGGRVELAALAGTTRFGAARERLRGASVVLRTATQLGAALALLELDGLARRIVLCTPDLQPGQLRLAAAAAEATAIVCDAPELERDLDLDGAALPVLRAGPPQKLATDAAEPLHDTEWALFTSGTTGPPKLAAHSLPALTGAIDRTAPSAARVWSTFYDIRRYGGLQILLRALVGGGSMVLSGTHEAPDGFLRRAGAAAVDFISGTPTHWRRALLSPAAAGVAPANVRLSGEVADQAILDKLRAAYPRARICHAFASTEAGVAFEVCDGQAGFPADWVDQPHGGVGLRVAEGTLRIRSGRTAARYLGAPAAPLHDQDGFVDTQDLVELRGDRYYFMGRRDGVINVGGLKVNPLEVEEIVNRHPGVEMSRVRARRSPIIGQVVVVDVVLRPDAPAGAAAASALEADILDSCRRALAAHKVPAAVRVVPALDVNAAGKLIRPAA